MTKHDVRDVFFKNYDGNRLNEALMASIEQVMSVVIKEVVEQPESLPDIVETIVRGKSRFYLFARIGDGASLSVPIHYLTYFDQIRKSTVDVIRYTRDNLEAMDSWFTNQFIKEDLEMMSSDMASSIEASAKRPANIRVFNSGELKIYNEFFSSALIGIVGPQKFQEFAKEFNKCAGILRECQMACRLSKDKTGVKES